MFEVRRTRLIVALMRSLRCMGRNVSAQPVPSMDAPRKGTLRRRKKEGGKDMVHPPHSDAITAQALAQLRNHSIQASRSPCCVDRPGRISNASRKIQGQRYSCRRREFNGPWATSVELKARVRSKK